MADYTLHEGVAKKTKPKPKHRSRNWLIFWLLVSLALLAGSAAVAHKHQLTGLQARLFYDFDNLNLGSGWTTAAKWVTEGLGAAYPIAACVLIPLAFKKYRLAWRFFVTAGGAFALAYIVKKLVNEPRPIAMLHGHLHQRVVETGPGFPSGHEAAAAALAFTLWFVLPAKWRFLSIIWVGAVGFSRLFLGVHTPVDVVGGFACGLLAVCVVRLLPKVIARPLRLDEV